AKDYDAAVTWFERVPAGSPDSGPAGLHRGQALVRLGREDDARMALAALADNDPTVAGRALLQLGQLQLRAAEYTKADTTFSKVAALAPDRAAEGLLYAGLTRFVRHDHAGALASFQRGLQFQTTPSVEAELQFWRAKVLPPGSTAAADALTAAAQAVPDSYYGLRAQELLDGPSLSIASVRPDWPQLSSVELSERADWLSSLG